MMSWFSKLRTQQGSLGLIFGFILVSDWFSLCTIRSVQIITIFGLNQLLGQLDYLFDEEWLVLVSVSVSVKLENSCQLVSIFGQTNNECYYLVKEV